MRNQEMGESMLEEKTTQEDIILDWIEQIHPTVRSQRQLVEKCIERYGEDIYFRHEKEIISAYQKYINKLQ